MAGPWVSICSTAPQQRNFHVLSAAGLNQGEGKDQSVWPSESWGVSEVCAPRFVGVDLEDSLLLSSARDF